MNTNLITCVIASAITSAAVGGVIVGAVTLQDTTPGTPQTGHLNITGTAIAGRVGVGTAPLNARIQVEDAANVQGMRSRTGGTAIFGQSTAATGTGYGGYFTSKSAGGRGVYGENTSTGVGNPIGGLFTAQSSSGIGVSGLAYSGTGTTIGVRAEVKSNDAGARALQAIAPNGSATAIFADGYSGVLVNGRSIGVSAFGADTAIAGHTNSGVAGDFQSASGTTVMLAKTGAAIEATGPIKKAYAGIQKMCVPIAYGYCSSSGTILNGTANFSVSYDTVNKQYAIAVQGVSLSLLIQTVLVTAGSNGTSYLNSISGSVILQFLNSSNAPVPNDFSIAIYDAASTLSPFPAPKHNFKGDKEWMNARPAEAKAYKEAYEKFVASQTNQENHPN